MSAKQRREAFNRALERGTIAAQSGNTKNPYKPGTHTYAAWLMGWSREHDKMQSTEA